MSEPDYVAHVQTLGTPELIRWIAGWKAGSYPRIAGEFELQQRRDKSGHLRGWIAIGISAVALAVSILALVLK